MEQSQELRNKPMHRSYYLTRKPNKNKNKNEKTKKELCKESFVGNKTSLIFQISIWLQENLYLAIIFIDNFGVFQ